MIGRSLIKLLPATWVRRLDYLRWFARAMTGAGPVPARPASASADGRFPFDYITPSQMQTLQLELWRNPTLLLEISHVRQMLATWRAEHLLVHRAIDRVAEVRAEVAFNTVDYNIEGAKSAANLDRPMIMMNVVTSIERIRKNIGSLDVLSIGPRSEIELFGLQAAGFNPQRIRAVDLFSYSPYVEVGDMHALPYPDASFDVVFLGWVLAYSRNQAAVVQEILRVCRDRAVVVVAGDYSDESRDRSVFKGETTHVKTCDQVLALFGEHAGRVYFRHDPEMPSVAMVMTVLEVRK
jgi:hypothetical protein